MVPNFLDPQAPNPKAFTLRESEAYNSQVSSPNPRFFADVPQARPQKAELEWQLLQFRRPVPCGLQASVVNLCNIKRV